MPEPDRKEDSVLTALKELQGIEQDRIQREKDAIRQKAEAEARSKSDAEHRAKEEEGRLQAEAVERARREQEERERADREGRLRVEESERRARIEADAKLQTERIRIEAEARAKEKKVPWGAIGVVIGLLVIVAGSLGVAYVNKEKERQRVEELAARERAERDRQIEAIMKDIQANQAVMDEIQRKLTQAQSAAEIEEYRNRLARESEKAQALRSRLENARGSGSSGPPRPKKKDDPCANSDDPLCGITK